MHYLITGPTGLVGNNLVRQLLTRGEKVRVLVRPGSDRRPLQDLPLDIFPGDVTDAESVRRACRDVQVVFHAAGIVHFGWSKQEEMQRVNVGGTRNIAQACREVKARLIQISSMNALGVGRRDKPATEDEVDPHLVPCPYMLSKRAADREVEAEVARGLDAVFVYPSLTFGPWDWKPSSGRMILEVARRFMPFAPWGGVSVCDIRDVTEAMLTAATKAPANRHYLLAGTNLPYVDVWRMIARISGSRPPIMRAGPLFRLIGAKSGDLWYRLTGQEPDINSAAVRVSSQYHYFDSSRAVKELGYRIRPVEECISDAWSWFRQMGYA